MKVWERALRAALSNATPEAIQDLVLGLQCPLGVYYNHEGEQRKLIQGGWVRANGEYCPLATLALPSLPGHPVVGEHYANFLKSETKHRGVLHDLIISVIYPWFRGTSAIPRQFYEAWDRDKISREDILRAIWDFYKEKEKKNK